MAGRARLSENSKLINRLSEKALSYICRTVPQLRGELQTLLSKTKPQRIAYWPSALRRFPVILADDAKAIICPLPDLVMYRITAGLYYDFCTGPQELLSEANNQFEEYVRTLIMAFLPGLEAIPADHYGPKKSQFNSPDVLLKFDQKISAVFECKATKLTYDAQFADDPIIQAEGAYKQLVKGVVQLWKFFSHSRRGVYWLRPIDPNALAVLLTLDTWVQVSTELRTEIIARAKHQIRIRSPTLSRTT